MKKFFTVIATSALFLTACQKETSDLRTDPQTLDQAATKKDVAGEKYGFQYFHGVFPGTNVSMWQIRWDPEEFKHKKIEKLRIEKDGTTYLIDVTAFGHSGTEDPGLPHTIAVYPDGKNNLLFQKTY